MPLNPTPLTLLLLIPLYKYLLPLLPRPIPYYTKMLMTQIFLMLSVSYGLCLAVLLAPWDKSVLSMSIAGRLFYRLGSWATGIRVRVVDGEERLRMRGVVFVGNHQRYAFFLFFLLCSGRRFPASLVDARGGWL
jgi:hypothetical protein